MKQEIAFNKGVIVGGLARELYDEERAPGVRWHVLRKDLRDEYVAKAEKWLADFEERNPPL